MGLKQHETTEKTIGENTFYILPFPAFTAANIGGELAGILAPAFAGLSGSITDKADDKSDTEDTKNTENEPDIDMSAFSGALSSLSGDKVEKLLKKLIITNENVSVEYDGKAQRLTKNIADEIFCGSVQNMFVLAFEVVKVNFGGFFGKLGNLYGFQKATTGAIAIATQQNTEN